MKKCKIRCEKKKKRNAGSQQAPEATASIAQYDEKTCDDKTACLDKKKKPV